MIRKMASFMGVLIIGIGGVTFSDNARARTLTVADLDKKERVSNVQISPDGKRVLYTVGTSDIEKNKNSGSIWMVQLGRRNPSAIDKTIRRHSFTALAPRWKTD